MTSLLKQVFDLPRERDDELRRVLPEEQYKHIFQGDKDRADLLSLEEWFQHKPGCPAKRRGFIADGKEEMRPLAGECDPSLCGLDKACRKILERRDGK